MTGDRGVSPVIGVVLLVGITVVLAAVTGSLVLGETNSMETDTPSASFAFAKTDSGNLSIRHTGGETLNASAVSVTVDGAIVDDVFAGTIRAGSVGTVPAANVSSGAYVSVVHEDNDGDTATLAAWEVP